MRMVLQSAFRTSLLRVRHERNLICRAFLRASQARQVHVCAFARVVIEGTPSLMMSSMILKLSLSLSL